MFSSLFQSILFLSSGFTCKLDLNNASNTMNHHRLMNTSLIMLVIGLEKKVFLVPLNSTIYLFPILVK